MNVKIRLTLMNFLQYAIWGAWLISLGSYLGGRLGFTGWQIGSFFATMGIASLFMPGIMGIIADRWVPAQKLLGICHILAAGFMFAAAAQTGYGTLYPMVLCSVAFFMPTIALSNSVAYNSLAKAGLDSVKAFPPIRVWGTVGFIAAMWVTSLLGWEQSPYQLYFSGVLGLLLGAYSFSLPQSPVDKSKQKRSWVDKLGVKIYKVAGLGAEDGAAADAVGVVSRSQTHTPTPIYRASPSNIPTASWYGSPISFSPCRRSPRHSAYL